MIDARELRLGSWVEHNDEWCYRGEDVYQFQWDDSDWYALGESIMFIENINPIPLTDQWLIDFGFEKVAGAYYITAGRITLEVTIIEDDISVSIETNVGMGFNSVICTPNQVHLLQNFWYAFTREELTKK